MDRLFNKEGFLNIDEIVANRPSFKAIMADSLVTDEELQAQAELTIASLRKVEALCNPEQQAAVADAIAELSVLFTVYHIHNAQDF